MVFALPYIPTFTLQLYRPTRINQDQQESLLMLCLIFGLVYLNKLQESSVFNMVAAMVEPK